MPAVTEPSDDALRQWLLQRLPPAEAAVLEEQLMHDDGLPDRLREAETDLFDDAARGALSAEEAQAFHAHRLADPAQRDRLRAARAWARVREAAAGEGAAQDFVPRTAVHTWRRSRAALAAAACVIVAVLAAIVWNVLAPSPPSSTIPTYSLLASTQRGSGPRTLRLPASGDAVHLQVEVTDTTHRYQLFVETDGRRRQIAGDLTPLRVRGYDYVEANVDAALLASGRHRLLLVDASNSAEPEQAWEVQVGEP